MEKCEKCEEKKKKKRNKKKKEEEKEKEKKKNVCFWVLKRTVSLSTHSTCLVEK